MGMRTDAVGTTGGKVTVSTTTGGRAAVNFAQAAALVETARSPKKKKVGRPRRKRGYSREFTAEPGKVKRYLLDQIPAPLWTTAQTRAHRKGLSMRALILQLLTEWNQQP